MIQIQIISIYGYRFTPKCKWYQIHENAIKTLHSIIKEMNYEMKRIKEKEFINVRPNS